MKEYNFKMYFLIVLLLFFETNFTYSMLRRRSTRQESTEMVPFETEADQLGDEMFPFDIAYTDEVKQFIKYRVSGIYDMFTFFVIIMNNIVDKIQKPRYPYKCDQVPHPSTPGTFRPTEFSQRNCRRQCFNLNFHYLSFLEQCISIAIEKIFPNEASHYKIKLFNPFREVHGDCVYYEKQQKFMCNCTIRYRIAVSKFLIYAVERAVSINKDSTYNDVIKNDFFAFVLLLKYHSHAAPLYLAYLAHKHKLNLHASMPPIELESDANFSTEVSSELLTEGSLTYNKGPILSNEYEIYQRLLNVLNTGSVNLKDFGYQYFDPFLPLNSCIFLSAFIVRIFLEILRALGHGKQN